MCLSWYLVSIISTDDHCHRDIKSRISSASRAIYVNKYLLIPISLFVLKVSFLRRAFIRAWNGPNTRDVGRRLEQRRLEWLSHVCQMPEHRSPRILLFGCLLSRRTACGPRLRLRDLARRDLGRHNVRGNSWYLMTQVRPEWRQFYTAQCDDEHTCQPPN